MKKNYEEPIVEVLELKVADIITGGDIWTGDTSEDF